MPRPSLHHLVAANVEYYAVLATKEGPKFYRVVHGAAFSCGVKDESSPEPYEVKLPFGVIALDENECTPDEVGHMEPADCLPNFIGYHTGAIPVPAEEKTKWNKRSRECLEKMQKQIDAIKQSKLFIPNTKPIILQ